MMSYLWIFLLASLAIGAKAQGDLDLADAFVPDPTKEPAKPAEEPKAPAGDDLDLGDALGPDPDPVPVPVPAPVPVPEKPEDDLPKGGGTAGGFFGDKDLNDLGDNSNDDKPDGGKGGARALDPNAGSNGEGAEEPQEAGSGQIAGIISAVGVAIVGAVSGFFAYQKKKLCFKIQGGDPESANKDSGTQAEPQVMSNLLQSS